MSVIKGEDQYDVRSYREGDETQIVEILKKSFPAWPKIEDPLKFWKWKYKANPNGYECYIISLNDKIIGASHVYDMRIKIGNVIVDAHCASEDAIHPEYRGKGIYKKLREQIKPLGTTHKVASFWSTRNPIMIEYEARRGRFPIPFNISKMMRINNIHKHLKNNPSTKPWSYPFLYFVKFLNNLKNRLNRGGSIEEVEVSRINKFDRNVDSFCEKIHEYYLLTLVRDQSYLNWRYSNPNADEVIILQAVKDEEIIGLCAAEIIKNNWGVLQAHIMDLLSLPGDLVTPHSLLYSLLELLDQRNVIDVHLRVTKEHPYRLIATRCGFMDFSRWNTTRIFINERAGHEYFKKNIDDMAFFPERLVYLSHGDIL